LFLDSGKYPEILSWKRQSILQIRISSYAKAPRKFGPVEAYRFDTLVYLVQL
jgi:hypothetical protein